MLSAIDSGLVDVDTPEGLSAFLNSPGIVSSPLYQKIVCKQVDKDVFGRRGNPKKDGGIGLCGRDILTDDQLHSV